NLSFGNKKIDIVQYQGRLWPLILKIQVLNTNSGFISIRFFIHFFFRENNLAFGFFFFLLMHLSQPVQADAGILPRTKKVDNLVDGGVHLPYYIGDCKQSPQRNISLYHFIGSNKCHQYVFKMVDEIKTYPLKLVQFQNSLIHMEQFYLDIFPTGAFVLFKVVKFYFLYPIDQFINGILIFRTLLEALIIQNFSFM